MRCFGEWGFKNGPGECAHVLHTARSRSVKHAAVLNSDAPQERLSSLSAGVF